MRVERRAYSPAEAAEELSLSVATVYRMIARGEIRAVKLGRSRRIHRDELERLVNPSYRCETITEGQLA